MPALAYLCLGLALATPEQTIQGQACPADSSGPVSTVLIWGETGAGKSTTLNKLTHGGGDFQMPAAVGYCKPDHLHGCLSTTYDTTSYLIPAATGNNCLKVVDTPGVEDTEGRDEQFQERLFDNVSTETDTIDIILVVWKMTDKLKQDDFKVFQFLRSSFPPSAWRNVVMVYGWWDWNNCPMSLFDGTDGPKEDVRLSYRFWEHSCRDRHDLTNYHDMIWSRAFTYMRDHLGTGDRQCHGLDDTNCIPSSQQVPHFGLQHKLDEDWLRAQRHVDMLDPSTYSDYGCCAGRPNEATELGALAHQLATMQTQTILVSSIVNYWLECKKAKDAVQLLLNGHAEDLPSPEDVLHLKHCLDGQIQSEVHEVAELLQSDAHGIQAKFALSMGEKGYVTGQNGFSISPSLLDQYPDPQTYFACQVAVSGSETSHQQHFCWQSLSNSSGLADVQTARDDLLGKVVCSCAENNAGAYSCSLPDVNSGCVGNTSSCTLSEQTWAYTSRSSICCVASTQCHHRGWVVDHARSDLHCSGNCTQGECCQCADGFSGSTCIEKECTCSGGDAARGEACPAEGMSLCTHCDNGYTQEGTVCEPFGCVSPCGECVAQGSRRSDHDCNTCIDGFHKVSGQCVPKPPPTPPPSPPPRHCLCSWSQQHCGQVSRTRRVPYSCPTTTHWKDWSDQSCHCHHCGFLNLGQCCDACERTTTVPHTCYSSEPEQVTQCHDHTGHGTQTMQGGGECSDLNMAGMICVDAPNSLLAGEGASLGNWNGATATAGEGVSLSTVCWSGAAATAVILAVASFVLVKRSTRSLPMTTDNHLGSVLLP